MKVFYDEAHKLKKLEEEAKMKELIQDILTFEEERGWEEKHSPKNLSMVLSVEASELVEIFQWLPEEESRNLNPEKLKDAGYEIADILIYLLNISNKLGLDPVALAKEKLEICKGRYPI